jgi:hypothetical protein
MGYLYIRLKCHRRFSMSVKDSKEIEVISDNFKKRRLCWNGKKNLKRDMKSLRALELYVNQMLGINSSICYLFLTKYFIAQIFGHLAFINVKTINYYKLGTIHVHFHNVCL